MSEAKRFNIDVDEFLHAKPYTSEHGQWVKWANYDALAADNARLRAVLVSTRNALFQASGLACEPGVRASLDESVSKADAALAGSGEGE